MIEQLKEVLGDNDFTNIIGAIYKEQKANILINGELTDSINIYRGMRQGCPLSPLLFIMTLEILNNSIRNNDEIKGLRIRQQQYKLLSFADDLALILGEPKKSYNALKQELDQYAEVSGMKINLTKTKMLTKNMTQDQEKELTEIMGIQCVKKIKYLGIYLSKRTSSLYDDNYEKLLKEVEQDLKQWEHLQISLLGRVATIKMAILPRMMFLFQMIPIRLNKKFFIKLNQIISKVYLGF